MATRCASTSLFFFHVLYLLSEPTARDFREGCRCRRGFKNRWKWWSACFHTDSIRSEKRLYKTHKGASPRDFWKLSGDYGGGGSPCKALLSRYVELWLCTVRFNNAAFSCFSYTDSCIHSQACKRNSRYCSVITVALLINEVYGFSKELHKFVILAFFKNLHVFSTCMHIF